MKERWYMPTIIIIYSIYTVTLSIANTTPLPPVLSQPINVTFPESSAQISWKTAHHLHARFLGYQLNLCKCVMLNAMTFKFASMVIIPPPNGRDLGGEASVRSSAGATLCC